MENIKQKIEEVEIEDNKRSIEIMNVPKIVIQEERGAQLFSLLLKAENKKWGEKETLLAKEATEYFENNPLSPDILKTIHEFHNQGVDEEILYNLALTYQHPERAEKIFEMAEKYKPHVKNPQEVYQKFLVILESFDKIFSSSPLAEKFTIEIERDKKERLERIDENKKRIVSLINFFKPDSKTIDIKKVSFIPTNPLYKANFGRAFCAFPNELIIMSHIDNILNQDHEFSHGIINPIVSKLIKRLTDEQRGKISQFASGKLKQDYGDGPYSLLCEEFIRTYTEIIDKGEKPQKYEDFKQKLLGINNEEFQKELKNSKNFKARCDELGVMNLEDLINKSNEYFEKFEKNYLRSIIFDIYQEYIVLSKSQINFEQFILEKFPNKI